ncbi:MAG: hypothetical protein HRU15_11220, partial [Planctomycetes bacterium]|nr:hypothetical protein [Planctomycetota bacterium]
RHSYWWDIHTAFTKATAVAHQVWNRGRANKPQQLRSGWEKYSHFTDPDSYIEGPTDSHIPLRHAQTMRLQFEQEFLRILGEGLPVKDSFAIPSKIYEAKEGVIGSALHGKWVTTGFGNQGNWSKSEYNKDVHTFNKGAESYSQKYPSRLDASDNTRAMEYLLNDYRHSFLGSLPLDFNGDGYAESTCNGWQQDGETVWSWWWDGVYEVDDDDASDPDSNHWLCVPGWYRFRKSEIIERQVNGNWQKLSKIGSPSQHTRFLEINKAFLNKHWDADVSDHTSELTDPWNNIERIRGVVLDGPVKNWSATGRFFIGPSKSFHMVRKVQMFNLDLEQKAYEMSTHAIVDIDANRDDDFSDLQYLYKRHTKSYYSSAYTSY